VGNVHTVTQVEPYRSRVGAALPIRPGHEDAVRLALVAMGPPYSAVEQAVRRVPAGPGQILSWPTGRWHLIIQSGGKWGWGELPPFLEHIAGCLFDARFYLDDEYIGFVDEYRVLDATLVVRRVVAAGGGTAQYLTSEEPEFADFGYTRMAEELDDWWLGADETAAMRQAFPRRWPTLAAAAAAEAEAGRWAEAVEAYRATLAAQSAEGVEASPQLLARYVRALGHVDPGAALEVAREAGPTWHAAEPRSLELLAQLEERHGTRERAVDALIGSLRSNYPHLQAEDHLYATARVLALAGELVAARDWLRVAELVDPTVADRAAVEPDLAALRGR